MTTPRLQTVLLAILDASLIVLLGFIWYLGQHRVHEPDLLAVHSLAEPDLKILNATVIPRVDVAGIRDQAVFHSRRSFFEPAPPSQIVPVPDYELAGTMDLPRGKRIAFLKKQSDGSSRTLHLGDDLEGWQVKQIDGARVVLAREGQEMELRGVSAAPSPGLLHGTGAPQAVQSEIRVLSLPATQRALVSTVSPEPRTYRPTPNTP